MSVFYGLQNKEQINNLLEAFAVIGLVILGEKSSKSRLSKSSTILFDFTKGMFEFSKEVKPLLLRL